MILFSLFLLVKPSLEPNGNADFNKKITFALNCYVWLGSKLPRYHAQNEHVLRNASPDVNTMAFI